MDAQRARVFAPHCSAVAASVAPARAAAPRRQALMCNSCGCIGATRTAGVPRITVFSDTCRTSCDRWARVGRGKLSLGSRKTKRRKRSALTWAAGSSRKPPAKRRVSRVETNELLQSRAEAEAAIAEAHKSHERLRQAIEILPQGIVFLDPEGRYVLWNKKYARSTASPPICSRRARALRIRCASALRAAIILKPPATRKNGSLSD
jgi:PAS domain-containing protein